LTMGLGATRRGRGAMIRLRVGMKCLRALKANDENVDGREGEMSTEGGAVCGGGEVSDCAE
jgi:hypothetical protein